jgi:AraC-like DNA-binding protein
LLDTLTLGGSPPAIQNHARLALEFWVTKFENLARESGLDPATARLAAEDAVAPLEGGLVLARVSGDRDVFRRAVESLRREAYKGREEDLSVPMHGDALYPHSYLAQRRMELAHEALVERRPSVFEVSESVGYQLLPTFSRAFKE